MKITTLLLCISPIISISMGKEQPKTTSEEKGSPTSKELSEDDGIASGHKIVADLSKVRKCLDKRDKTMLNLYSTIDLENIETLIEMMNRNTLHLKELDKLLIVEEMKFKAGESNKEEYELIKYKHLAKGHWLVYLHRIALVWKINTKKNIFGTGIMNTLGCG